MKVNQKKLSYTAPKMEATSFKAEQGYASSTPVQTNTFSIGMGAAGL